VGDVIITRRQRNAFLVMEGARGTG
jgi:hypothetical protein